MNPKDYDFWSVGNEQLSLQNHFPKHIPVIKYLNHSGTDSPETPPDFNNASANNYTCAEPEILRRSLESALKVAHDEIEKYQLTLNENTAKKLLEATAQGAFRDDPNIRNCQTQQYPREYKQSKLRLMDLFIPPIREEDGDTATPTAGRSRRTSSSKQYNNSVSPNPMVNNSSLNERMKRNSTPSILSTSMFQPPTPTENKKPPLYNPNSQKPPIIPMKKDKRHNSLATPISPPPPNNIDNTSNDEVFSKEELEKLNSSLPKNKSQSFSYSSGRGSFTENEQSVTTIKSNINDELLQLLNKYYPNKNKSENNLENTGVEGGEGEAQSSSSVAKTSGENLNKSSNNVKVIIIVIQSLLQMMMKKKILWRILSFLRVLKRIHPYHL
eukprot:jgi/Orpsp1_1/1178422/evm.model.c7180000065219.1